MNPLPEHWRGPTCNKVHDYVLLDGAMQHAMGRKLAERPGTGRSLLFEHSAAAQALGIWLIPADLAKALDIDGVARGVNWIASSLAIGELFTHLLPWVRGKNAAAGDYLRLADGRALRALWRVWTLEQRASLCAPLTAWWLADRDGKVICLDLPVLAHGPIATSSDLDHEQSAALLEAGVPDQLMYQLKGTVHFHPSLPSWEARHHAAAKVCAEARLIGYQAPGDFAALVAWALTVGTGIGEIDVHPAIAGRLVGTQLWQALLDEPSVDDASSADIGHGAVR